MITSKNQPTVSFSFDLVKDSLRVIAAPGQNPQAAMAFAGARGIFDSFLESRFVPVPPGGQNFSAAAIVQQAIQQGIPIVVVNPQNVSLLQSLNLSADAIARLTANIQNGLAGDRPTRPVMIGSTQVTAWINVNPTTGEMIAQSENGQHQA